MVTYVPIITLFHKKDKIYNLLSNIKVDDNRKIPYTGSKYLCKKYKKYCSETNNLCK